MTLSMAFEMSWSDHGTTFRMDIFCLMVALLLHTPLLMMKFDPKKRAIDHPRNRLVAVDLIDAEAPKKTAPPPPVPRVKKKSFMAKLRSLVRKEPPPPPPPKKLAPKKMELKPKQIRLEPKLKMEPKRINTLKNKSGFSTNAKIDLVKEQKISLKVMKAGITPLSAEKMGIVKDRGKLKKSKGNFQLAKAEVLSSITGNGPGLADAALPAVGIRVGNKATTEKFSSAPVQKKDKGSFGKVNVDGLGGPKSLTFRDKIIARDAPSSMIGGGASRLGARPGVPGGVPGATGTKKDAGRFNRSKEASGFPRHGRGTPPAVRTSAPKVAPITVRKKKKKSMFVITGPLKNRKIEKKVLPEYPVWAQTQGIEASVVLQFTVKPQGYVKDVIVVLRTSGYPQLDKLAMRALSMWKFVPLAGETNREEIGSITFNYSLS